MFKRMAGVDVLHMPYKGSGPAMTDLISGQVQAMIETAPLADSHIKSGKVRALATTTAEAVVSLPGVPTAPQAGFKALQVTTIFGLVAPAGTTEPVIAYINQDLIFFE